MKLLLIERKEGKRKILIDLEKVRDINTEFGILKKEDLKKLKPGDRVKTHKGVEFSVVEPTFEDLLIFAKRGPQIITLKDAATIVAYTNLRSGCKVVDAGTGSGILACFLAHVVRPNGLVYTYEKRKDFLKIARFNINLFEVGEWVKLKNKDIYKGIEEKNLDLITLDLPEPWKVLRYGRRALKKGGYLVAFLPNMTQVIEFVKKVRRFGDLKVEKTIEITERSWNIREKVARPSFSFPPTTFITFVRRI